MPERFSASVASRHLSCQASANLDLAIPGWTPPDNAGDTKASIKGTDIHKILEDAAAYTPREMQGIAEAMAYVAALRQKRRFTILTEATSEGWWFNVPQKPKTTADVVLYVQDELHVVDYKFGKIPVEVRGNTQGMYYALAFLPLAPKVKGVHFHIVQPFANNIDSTFFTTVELEQFRLDCLAAEKEIQAGSTVFQPSDACMFCPANPHTRGAKGTPKCPAMMQLLYPVKPLDEDAIFDELNS